MWPSDNFGIGDVAGKLRDRFDTGMARKGNKQRGYNPTGHPFAAHATTPYSQIGLCERRESPAQAAGPVECQTPVGRGWGRGVG